MKGAVFWMWFYSNFCLMSEDEDGLFTEEEVSKFSDITSAMLLAYNNWWMKTALKKAFKKR